jgi:hypothetical protein
MAEQVAYEAEKINRELFKLVRKLQSRKEESDVSPPPPPSPFQTQANPPSTSTPS